MRKNMIIEYMSDAHECFACRSRITDDIWVIFIDDYKQFYTHTDNSEDDNDEKKIDLYLNKSDEELFQLSTVLPYDVYSARTIQRELINFMKLNKTDFFIKQKPWIYLPLDWEYDNENNVSNIDSEK